MSSPRNAVAVVIPAYQPSETLAGLVAALRANGFGQIVVVNDGSEDDAVFRKLPREDGVTVLRHDKNRGKGAALKSGFRHVLDHLPATVTTLLTVDADGQHLPEDAARVSSAAERSPDTLVLGARRFDRNVPLRSSFGNTATRLALGWIKNIKLRDTQTGLRAYPRDLAAAMLDIASDRYDFEFKALLLASRKNTRFEEVPISTVYIDGNTSSHFRPFLDSMRIYSVFARFASISLASFLLDIAIFTIAFHLNNNIYASTYVARASSSSFNFFGNKFIVFKSREKAQFIRQSVGYFMLVVFIAMLSATLVDNAVKYIGGPVVLIKIIVDTGLFLMNFFIQRTFLFKRKS